MDFNDRVLQLAEDPATPLLERVKFAAIWTSNLDEFFMVRVAGLHDQVDAGVRELLDDRRTPSQTIDGIRELAVEQYERVHDLLERTLRPELSEHGISIVGLDDVSATRTARRSTSATAARSTRCSRRWRSGSAGRSRTSRTCRCPSRSSCATRRRRRRRSRA